MMRRHDRAKRAMDLVLTVPGVLLSLPIQAAVAVAVRHKLGSPILFKQERPGRYGRPFTVIKFRTMRAPDPARVLASDADRMCPLGSFLRSTSLDELPTLWNVLAGDMSLVGPRPLLMAYLPRYSPDQARRHEVRPGLTGLAQVSGRNALSWDDKFALDVAYVDTGHLLLDVGILARTVLRVIRREGISADGAATMPEFTGDGQAVAA